MARSFRTEIGENSVRIEVHYIVVYSGSKEIQSAVKDVLKDSLSDVYIDSFSDDMLERRVIEKYTKEGQGGRKITGLSVIFEVDEEYSSEIIEEFSKALILLKEPEVEHVLKLFDQQLFKTNVEYAEEIFEIEMKLREALSLIFIDTYGTNFYAFLDDIQVKFPEGDELNEERLKTHFENQFFFLLFSDYININNRKVPKNIDNLLKYINDSTGFEELKKKIGSMPIQNEKYTDFIANIKAKLAPIEKIRNPVAHNRAIPNRSLTDYKMAREPLLKTINEFLADIGRKES